MWSALWLVWMDEMCLGVVKWFVWEEARGRGSRDEKGVESPAVGRILPSIPRRFSCSKP